MAEVIIRKIPPELWAKVKAKAQREGRWLRWVLIDLLTKYVEDEKGGK